MADPTLGGAPPLLVPRFELRVLALARAATTASSSSPAAATTSSPASSSSSSAQDAGKGVGGSGSGSGGVGGGAAAAADGGGVKEEGEYGQGGGQGDHIPEQEAPLLLSAAVVESHPMDSDENCVCMTLVRLEQGGSPRMYVAVGTGMNEPQGEDKAVRKILIFFSV